MRLARWVVINAAVLYLAVQACFFSVEWAGNLLKFILWVFAVLYTMIAASKDGKAMARKKGTGVPAWLSASSDWALICILAAHGWFFYATLALVQMWGFMATYHGTSSLESAAEEPTK